MGSKARFSKDIIPYMIELGDGKSYVEPFVGGGNMIANIPDIRPMFANDSNKYLIAMWKALQDGWFPEYVDKDVYESCRRFEQPDHLVGWAGFNCSYSGKWFGGYAGKVQTKAGLRDYQEEAREHMKKQIPLIKDVVFSNGSYDEMHIPEDAIIYCDPPYANTTGYKDKFDNEKFWEWARTMSVNHKVFISEYTAPDDFECIWFQETKSSLSANGKIGGNKVSVEKLFTLKR